MGRCTQREAQPAQSWGLGPGGGTFERLGSKALTLPISAAL